MSACQVPGTLAAKELKRMARDPAVFCFPGFFPGLLDSRAGTVNDDLKLAASRAIAACVRASELGEEYIIPKRVQQKRRAGGGRSGGSRGVQNRHGAPRRHLNPSALP